MATAVLEPKMSHNPLAGPPAPTPLPFDLSKGHPILAVHVGENEAVATMGVRQLLAHVHDPRLLEDRKRTASDPLLNEYAALRAEVQRVVRGPKENNAKRFAKYLIEGLLRKRPFIVPAITLYHPKPLESTPLGHGLVALMLPYGDYFVAIDGETQRLAWQLASKDLAEAKQEHLIRDVQVKVVIHHGKSITDARQGFYDLNLLEVKPNVAIAISMDSMDIATRITRVLMDESDVVRDRIHLQRRQLRSSDPEVLTISALRSGVVTTILGASGLQVGAKAISLPDDVDVDAVQRAVIDVWVPILEQLEEELDRMRRPYSVASSPAVIAAIGIVAHHTMSDPARKADVRHWTVEEVLERLEGVVWDRTNPTGEGQRPSSAWDGIAGKFTPSGRFALGGPKELGNAIAAAIENRDSAAGRRIRGEQEDR